MKKILLLVMALGFGVSIMAQQAYKFKMEPTTASYNSKPMVGVEPVKDMSMLESKEVSKPVLPSTDRDVNFVTIIDIGTCANPYSYGYNGGQKSTLWADPDLNMVTNFHRMGGALDPGGYSGDLGYDISRDGGLTWENQIECYIATENAGGTYYTDAARYPNHGVYAPTDNIDDAYVAYFAPNLDQSNAPDSWGGYSYGVANIGDTSVRTKHLQSTHDEFYQYIPEGYALTSQGTVFVTDVNENRQVDPVEYEGGLILNKGTWDEGLNDYVYDQEILDLDVWDYFILPWFTQVAFAPDGMTGYVAALNNNGETWRVEGMPSIYPMFWKTTDGGETWDGPYAIQIDGPDGIGGIVYGLLTDEQIAMIYEEPVPDREEIPYTFLGDFEIAVDNNGNLHIAGIVAAAGTAEGGGISFFVANGLSAAVDMFTHDGGTTFEVEEMGRIRTYEGTWGTLTEQNRIQVTTSPAADKIFISWLDTDLEDETDNNRPNIWCRGFDPATYMKTQFIVEGEVTDGPANVTLFSEGMWQAYMFNAAYTCFYNDGTYTIPFTYLDMDPTNDLAPVQVKYITDFTFTDAEFTIQDVKDNFTETNIAEVSQNFPNPFSGESYVTVSLNEGSDLSMDVYTLTGQKVSGKSYGYMSSGSHTLTIDANNLPSGVYFYTITAGENKSTHKMIVE